MMLANIKTLADFALQSQRVLIREDLNVPIRDGQIQSDARLKAALPTIQQASSAGAKVVVMSHLGRPQEGQFAPELSLKPIAAYMTQALGQQVRLIARPEDIGTLANGEVVLLENVRFNQGELADDEALARRYAQCADIFVMDAFGTAHRAQASTHGVAKFAKNACAGPLLVAELQALRRALDNPARPVVAIVGGAKVSSKLALLNNLSQVVDQLIVGGGIANTFIKAAGHDIGTSLYEPDLVPTAAKLAADLKTRGADIPIPVDVVAAREFSANASARHCAVGDVKSDEMILDIGADSITTLVNIIQNAGTIVWNGPVGVFEFAHFAKGTELLGRAIAASNAFSIAGGGDTLAAIEQFNLSDGISYISTGGGAFLEFLEGKTLPAVAVLTGR